MKKLINRLKETEHRPRDTQVTPLIEMVIPIREMEDRGYHEVDDPEKDPEKQGAPLSQGPITSPTGRKEEDEKDVGPLGVSDSTEDPEGEDLHEEDAYDADGGLELSPAEYKSYMALRAQIRKGAVGKKTQKQPGGPSPRLKAINQLFKMAGDLKGLDREQYLDFIDTLHGKKWHGKLPSGPGAAKAKKDWASMKKRYGLKDSVEEQPEGEPLEEADTIYWKSVSKKFPVTKSGEDYFAKMPDGKQKVDWKPAEAAEAKKHLDGLMGKKESTEMEEAVTLKPQDQGTGFSKSWDVYEGGGNTGGTVEEMGPRKYRALQMGYKPVGSGLGTMFSTPEEAGKALVASYKESTENELLEGALADLANWLAGAKKKKGYSKAELDKMSQLMGNVKKAMRKESVEETLEEQMSREAGVLNAKNPKVEFMGVEQLPDGKLGLKVSLDGIRYIYAPMEQQKQPVVAKEAYDLGKQFQGLMEKSIGDALVWLRHNAEVVSREETD